MSYSQVVIATQVFLFQKKGGIHPPPPEHRSLSQKQPLSSERRGAQKRAEVDPFASRLQFLGILLSNCPHRSPAWISLSLGWTSQEAPDGPLFLPFVSSPLIHSPHCRFPKLLKHMSFSIIVSVVPCSLLLAGYAKSMSLKGMPGTLAFIPQVMGSHRKVLIRG